MRRCVLGWVMILVLVAWGTAARADDAAVRKELQAANDRLAQAMRDKDLKAVLALHTADFSTRSFDGQVRKRAEAEAELKDRFAATKQLKRLSYRVEKVTVEGNEAVAETVQDVEATMTANGRDFQLVMRQSLRQRWVRTAEGWKLRASDILQREGTVDGLPLPEPRRA